MNTQLNNLPVNWFDVFFAVNLFIGLQRGKKRGMSEELIPLIQWIAIILCAGLFYQPAGQLLAQKSGMSMLTSFIIAYVAIALVVWSGFLLVKQSIGGKLVGSDIFGKSEYYLGMPAGVIRFFLCLMMGLALLNARFYSQKEIEANLKYQKDNYGEEFFPGMQSLQATVFEKSFTGPYLKKGLSFLLITPTAPESKQFKQREFAAP